MRTPMLPVINHLEELRRKARLSQSNVVGIIGVSRRTYIQWVRAAEVSTQDSVKIREGWHPSIRYAVFLLEQGFRTDSLPVRGHDRRPETAKRRDEVVADLIDRYTFHS